MYTTPHLPPEQPSHHRYYSDEYSPWDALLDTTSAPSHDPRTQPDHLPEPGELFNGQAIDEAFIDDEGYLIDVERNQSIDLDNVASNLAAVALKTTEQEYAALSWSHTLSEAGRRRDMPNSPLWNESTTVRHNRLLQTPNGHAVIARVIDDVLTHEYPAWNTKDRVRYELATRAQLAAMIEQQETARAALRRPIPSAA